MQHDVEYCDLVRVSNSMGTGIVFVGVIVFFLLSVCMMT